MRFGLLGTLQVHDDDGRRISVAAARQRALLAALLLRAGSVVPAWELVDLVWDGDPPPRARNTLSSYVMRLRRTLADAGRRVRSESLGYVIDVADGELDTSRFVTGLHRGLAAAAGADWARTVELLDTALSLWRGEPLADVPSEVLRHKDGRALTEQRLLALETHAGARLCLGAGGELVAELQTLRAAHPLRERLSGHLMLALYRGGRPAEAVAVFASCRRSMVDELGIEPGAELQDLHRRILRGDPDLTRPATAEPVRPAVTLSGPDRVPPDLPDFLGRDEHAARLCDLLAEPAAICAVTGTAGVGKTALAVRVAHRIGERFPDGRLYADLRGSGPYPRTSADVLADFLRDLGVPDAAIPPDEYQRAGRYRGLLAERRMLVVLDDVHDAEICSLLPGAAGCGVLITGRHPLCGLAGADTIELDPLPPADAVTLLTGIAGRDGAADEVVARCGGLPLAIRIAGASAHGGLRALADHLAEAPGHAVPAACAVGYRALDEPAAAALRLLGLAVLPSVPLPAVAALLDRTERETAVTLDILVDAHLVLRTDDGRYRCHDLVREHAIDRAIAEHTADERAQAIDRMLGWYLDTAARADRRQARHWFETEHDSLLAAVGSAAATGAHRTAGRLAALLYPYLEERCRWQDLVTVAGHGLAGARTRGDRGDEIAALDRLGVAHTALGRHAVAEDLFTRALAVAVPAEHHGLRTTALGNLGNLHIRAGRPDKAADCYRQVLAAARRAGDDLVQARAMAHLALAYNDLGQHAAARQSGALALDVAEAVGDRAVQGLALVQCGRAAHGLRRHHDAIGHVHAALGRFAEIGAPASRGLALIDLGDIQHDLGHHATARQSWHRAYAVLTEIGDDRADQAAARIGTF